MNLNGVSLNNDQDLVDIDQINNTDVMTFYPYYYRYFQDSSVGSSFTNQLPDSDGITNHPFKIFEISSGLDEIDDDYIVFLNVSIPICLTTVDISISGIISSIYINDTAMITAGEGVVDIDSSYYDYACIVMNYTAPKSEINKISIYLDDPKDTNRSSFKYFISIIGMKSNKLLLNPEVQI